VPVGLGISGRAPVVRGARDPCASSPKSGFTAARFAPCYPHFAGQDARKHGLSASDGASSQRSLKRKRRSSGFALTLSSSICFALSRRSVVRLRAGSVEPQHVPSTDLLARRSLSKRDATPARRRSPRDRENWKESTYFAAEVEHSVQQICRHDALLAQLRRSESRWKRARPAPSGRTAGVRNEGGNVETRLGCNFRSG
jgi:hypothetical protein